jgi:hypothetical protein
MKKWLAVFEVVFVLVALLVCAWASSQIPWPQNGLMLLPMVAIVKFGLMLLPMVAIVKLIFQYRGWKMKQKQECKECKCQWQSASEKPACPKCHGVRR